jgi:hypothetical protein
MTRGALGLLLGASLGIAQAPAPAPQAAETGIYHFVTLGVRSKSAARVTTGEWNRQPTGGTFTGQVGAPGSAQKLTGTAKLAARDNTPLLSGLPDGQTNLRLHASPNGEVMIGSTQDLAQSGGDILLAVRQSMAAPVVNGNYSGVLLRFGAGKAGNAETGHMVFRAENNRVDFFQFISHEAAWDDINRNKKQNEANFLFQSNGAGTLRFSSQGDLAPMANGKLAPLKVFASANGGLVTAVAGDGPNAVLMIAVRDMGESAEAGLTGPFSSIEIIGESPYAFDPAGPSWSTSDGSLRSAGDGNLMILERMQSAGTVTNLITSAKYRLGSGSERSLGPQLRPRVRNLAFSDELGVLVATWVALPDELTLEHGFMLGIRSAPGPAVAAIAVTAMHEDGSQVGPPAPAKPGETLTLTIAGLAAPQASGPFRVYFNGIAAAPAGLSTTAGLVQLRVPVPSDPAVNGAVALGIQTAGLFHDTTTLPVTR